MKYSPIIFSQQNYAQDALPLQMLCSKMKNFTMCKPHTPHFFTAV
jgi:hypothetical protein